MRQRVDEAVALLLPGRPGLGTERPDAQQQQQTALERLADPRGEVAKNFRVPGFRGSVSFITSMTTHFCGECNRLRLLADGSLKVCLFGANEVSLRDAMRGGATDDDLRLIIGAALRRKKAAHAGMKELAVTGNRPMIAIGG
jgi:cyclic pyranopterin phosphate synthase